MNDATPQSAAVVRRLSGAVREVPAPVDLETVFLRLARRPGCVWLDSAGGPAHLRRWSVLTAEPAAALVADGAGVRLEAGGAAREMAEDPLAALEQLMAELRVGDGPGGLPYGPGLYGALAYDLAPWVEPTAGLSPEPDIDLPALWFGLYEAALVVDHRDGRAWVTGEGAAGAAIEDALSAAAWSEPPAQPGRAEGVAVNLGEEEFRRAVARAREYIAAGDIYQVNLSRRYTVNLRQPGAVDLYRRLRRANPAPYGAYLDLGGGRAVLSSSPELYLELAGGGVRTRPIKGTRSLVPGDREANARRRQELLDSAKDRAELVMIVDLERNDLGRVARYGSVRVTEDRAVEDYASVMHTVATVEAELARPDDVAGLLRAAFPGGSVTGAPKVRAMQIIAELEPTRRSVYTGAVGYLGPATASAPPRAALNIPIRTLLVANGRVHCQVGGGIVADSDPDDELRETQAKARAMLAALGLAP